MEFPSTGVTFEVLLKQIVTATSQSFEKVHLSITEKTHKLIIHARKFDIRVVREDNSSYKLRFRLKEPESKTIILRITGRDMAKLLSIVFDSVYC